VAPLVRVPRTLRRCGVLGLGFERVQIAGRRLVVVGPGGAIAGWVRAAGLFFGALGACVHDEWLDRADFRPHPGWVMLVQGTQATVELSHRAVA
jgi:hypothetical protein